jgi:uncharacterized cofD-like protein
MGALKLRRAVVLVAVAAAVVIAGLALSYKMLLAPALGWIDKQATWFFLMFLDERTAADAKWAVAGALLFLGIYLGWLGVRNLAREFVKFTNPSFEGKSVGAWVRQRALSTGPNIVAIGGGTGLSTLLRGLKHRTNRITAVVTVTDDGGSSGRLITDKGMLPPGDIRNCLVALADAEKSMTDLFQHRFEGASGSLSGHSVGNLLIAAMVDITGDFDRAITEISRVLAIRGRVLPATLDHVKLRAEMEDGSVLCGETQIVNSRLRIRRVFLDPGEVTPLNEVLQSITDADIIVVGPGSVFTSIIPPLLVPGVARAIADSPAIKVYVCNVMTQPGETDGLTASEHVHAIEGNVGHRVFDYILVNKARPGQYLLDRYAEFGQQFVDPDIERIRAMGLKAIAANLISETDLVRHDPMRIAEAIVRVAK